MAKIISHLFCVSILLSLVTVSLSEQSTLMTEEKDGVVSPTISSHFFFNIGNVLYY